jgi:hypothetical protein
MRKKINSKAKDQSTPFEAVVTEPGQFEDSSLTVKGIEINGKEQAILRVYIKPKT